MLRYLKISNVAIIDQVEVEFAKGFNVLTGETGAGKSILIGALDLLLGSKASGDLIRTGEDEASVEGLFEIPTDMALPEGLDAEAAATGELLLSRRLTRSGRSRCSVNGNLATLTMLQALGRQLVNIFGQHEHRVLLDPEEHVEILDRFGGLLKSRQAAADTFGAWTKATRDLAQAERRQEEIKRQVQENAAAAEELTQAALRDGEEQEILEEREVLKKASQIREKAYEAYENLYSRSGSLLERLSEVKKGMDYLASANPKLESLRENFQEAVYRLEDVAMELRGLSEKSRSDPGRLEQIEERLALIRRLKKKYGADVPGLIQYLETLGREAGDVLEARTLVKNLRAAVESTRKDYLAAAHRLSSERRDTAAKLESSMSEELRELAMPEALFRVHMHEIDEQKGSTLGLEKVEFFLASNPGEAPRPLARIASGGELSRIMLSLKALQLDARGAGTMIFDEVDAGIGGHTAFSVGTRLARVAERQQVLCVTHLHQIAALADHHLSVSKSVSRGRTRIRVEPLDRDQRVDELARMLGASPSSESVKEHVRRLMEGRVVEGSG